MKYLKTKRLYLRDFKVEDTNRLIHIMNDKDVMQFFPTIPSKDTIIEFINENSISIKDRGFGLFAVERKGRKECIGIAGIRVKQYDEYMRLGDIEHLFPCIEIFVMLDKRYWNQGLATEALMGVLKFTRKKTDIKHVYAFISMKNLPAINVIDKLDMKPFYEFINPYFVLGHRKAKSMIFKKDIQ